MNKLSIILVVLFISLSLMISVAAYFSSNPAAFVQATIKLDIDFGNVFPDMDVTESFTIDSLDSSDYIITLLAPTDPNVLDIRPNLTVWKDTTELDIDGPISGAPDYTGTGSFIVPGDASDKWFVTFSVPDVTLPDGVAYDYGCTISVEPIIAPPPVPPGDLVLRPNGDGTYTQFDLPSTGSHYLMVDDIGTHDNDTTFVGGSSDNSIDLYDIEDTGLATGTPIYKVMLYAVMKGNGTDMTNGFYGLKSGSVVHWGNLLTSLPTTYHYYLRGYANDPSTGNPWTVAAIDALQVGFYVDNSANSGLYGTQIYVVVDVTPP